MQRSTVPFCPPSPLSLTFTSLCTMPRSWRYTGDKMELSETGCPLLTPCRLPPSEGAELLLTQHQDQLSSKQADGGLGEAPSCTPQCVQVPSAAVGAHCQDGSQHPYPEPRRHQGGAVWVGRWHKGWDLLGIRAMWAQGACKRCAQGDTGTGIHRPCGHMGTKTAQALQMYGQCKHRRHVGMKVA